MSDFSQSPPHPPPSAPHHSCSTCICSAGSTCSPPCTSCGPPAPPAAPLHLLPPPLPSLRPDLRQQLQRRIKSAFLNKQSGAGRLQHRSTRRAPSVPGEAQKRRTPVKPDEPPRPRTSRGERIWAEMIRADEEDGMKRRNPALLNDFCRFNRVFQKILLSFKIFILFLFLRLKQ